MISRHMAGLRTDEQFFGYLQENKAHTVGRRTSDGARVKRARGSTGNRRIGASIRSTLDCPR